MTRMMKKLTAVVIAIILIVGLMPFGVSAEEIRISRNGLLYSLYGRSAVVLGYSDAQGTLMKSIEIPETVTYQGYSFTVDVIASGAFYFSDGSSPLESVTIPKGVNYIESYAFCRCENLKKVTFANSSKLETLSEGVFKDCYELSSINLPNGLKTIGNSAFYYCCRLTELNIPDGVTTIGDYAFAYTDVKYFTIPDSVTSFGDMVFDPMQMPGRQATPYSITYKGTKAQWDALLDGKSLGYGLYAPVYVKADITFNNNGRGASVGTKTVEAGTAPRDVHGIGENGPQLTDEDYAFMGWYMDKECTRGFNFGSLLKDDVTVYAKWKKVKHTVTYKIENGKWSDGTDKPVSEVVYDGNNPAKVPSGMTCERGFGNGAWDSDPSKAVITGDAEFTYSFSPLTKYTVIWLNDNGTELDSKIYFEGEDEPTTDKTPEKPEDVQFTYTFERWDYGTVDGTTKTYKPIFTNNEKTLYTVIWLNYDGTEYGLKTYYEGQNEPTIFGSPQKPSDIEYNYSFKEWDEGTVDGTTKTYKPIFTQTEKPVYTVLVGYGTANPAQSKAGKLITLTPDPAEAGWRFTGWEIMEGDITIENNTFIMPESNVEVYATYALAKNVDVDFDYPEKAYVGKSFTVSGTVNENENILDVGGTMTITFSSSVPEAEGAEAHTVPVTNGEFSLTVPALNKDVHYVWLEYSGYGEYASALLSNTVKVYELSSVYLEDDDVKTTYELNEELDLTNLDIRMYWMDGTDEYYPVSADMVSGFDNTKPGEQTLTVTCPYPTTDELTYKVYVNEAPTEPTEPSTDESQATEPTQATETTEATVPTETTGATQATETTETTEATEPTQPGTGDTKPTEPSTGETNPTEPSTGETNPTEPSTGETLPTDPTINLTDISICTVTGIKDKTYSGKAQTQNITVKDGGYTLVKGTDYTVTYKNNKDAGKASITITGEGKYTGAIQKTFKINKAKNPMTVKVAAKTIKLKTVKKKAQTVKAITVKKAKGKVTYKLKSVPKALGKLVKINSKGVITIGKWKKAQKGTYKIKVKISAKGDKNYKSKSLTKTVTIKVK